MIWIYRIFSGFLKVRFYGENKEKILSVCAVNGIILWNSHFTEQGIESYIPVRDFKQIRKIAPKKGLRVHIIKKFGFPFVANRYKQRWGIAVGAVLFFAVLNIMTNYIWVIDISGNQIIKDKEILDACKRIGITEGINKKSLNPKIKREELLLGLDSIAWASLNIEGSRLTVNVTETKAKENKKSYSNIKASCDGIIEKIDIVSGTSVVKVGDAVKKGDLLVSGIVETAEGTRFVNSKGTITATINKNYILKEKYTQKICVPTGQVKKKYGVEILGLKIPLYLSREDKSHTSFKTEKTVKIFEKNLPLKIYKKRFEFYEERIINYSYEQLCRKLEKRFNEELRSFDDKKPQIIKKHFSKTSKDVLLSAKVKVRENIAYEDILLIYAGNQG